MLRSTAMREPTVPPTRLLLVAALLLFLFPASSAQTPQDQISPEVEIYVLHILDIMQHHALHKKEIDWKKVTDETLARARQAHSIRDSYPAIAYALTQLKETHSFLQLPESLSGDQEKATYADIRRVLARPVSDRKPSPFSPSKEILGHIDYRNGAAFAHVVVPSCAAKYAEWEKNAPDFQRFADSLHATVLDLASQKPIGWIVDLRGNGGGNMWPMLAGIGALLGQGELGSFISADGDRDPWHYRDGQAGTVDTVLERTTQTPFLLPGTPFVAVLFDRGTASSGEAIAISFAGRPREKSFGEHTAGYSTANEDYPLSDGAILFLCNALEADRTGRIYPDGLDPDVKIEEPKSRPPEDLDEAIRAAEEWLLEQSQMPSTVDARLQ